MLAQVLAIIIFLAMFLLIILEIWERQWITLACGLLTLLLVFGLGMHSMGAIMRTLNLQSFFTTGFWYAAGESSEASSGINWQTIIFIAGMMIMVEGMAKVGFFRWLCMEIAKTGKISGYSDLYDVYVAVFRTGYVYRQYYRYPVSGSSYDRTVTAFEI